MVNLSSSASMKQMSLTTPIQSLGLNNSKFPSASSILKRSIHKPISNTLRLSSQSVPNRSMDKPAFSIRNPNPASSIPDLSISKRVFITSNLPPGSIKNERIDKLALTNGGIPHRAVNASNFNDPGSPSGYDLYGRKPLNNPTVDAISVPKGWSNTRLVLPYICQCFEPEEYGLPSLNPILCDDVDTRFLLEASGIYYLYNQVSDTLYRFDRPTELSSIVSALGGDWKNIKITEMELL